MYPMLVDSPVVATLAGLLSHDNTDIAVEVLDLLQELTDAGEVAQLSTTPWAESCMYLLFTR